jgi:pimeloyl-ACP methyl ester carboxylesterase
MATLRTMSSARVNGIELAYEIIGEPDGLPLLLVGGLGTQLVGWHDDLVRGMVRRGYQVIRFDNRDVGASTHLSDLGAPDILAILAGTAPAPYSLTDLAADAVGLLDVLGLDAVHVFGVSMGGMIAQAMALSYPDRVRSLTSVSSSTGEPVTSAPTPEAAAVLLLPAATTREESMDRAETRFAVIGSPQFATDTAWLRTTAGRYWDRGRDADGIARQLAAVVTAPDRTPALSTLAVPTLIIHGGADPLVPVAAGRLAATVIPTAEMLEIEGMGHDLPRAVWDRILDKLDDVAHRGELVRDQRADQITAA